ncbi:MAG: RsiV family protein [Kiritimatiellaeota bacterium]|nr:RsiV family protein [Kiritimatiellota bacterium]
MLEANHRGEKATMSTRFPSIGNGNDRFFQALEKLALRVSNAWKKENRQDAKNAKAGNFVGASLAKPSTVARAITGRASATPTWRAWRFGGIFLLLLTLGQSECNAGSFQVETIRVATTHADDFNATNSWVSYTVDWPTNAISPSALQTARARVWNFFESSVNGTSPRDAFPAMRDEFMTEWGDCRHGAPFKPRGYFQRRSARVSLQTEYVIQYTMEWAGFLGGNHPNSFTSYLILDTRNGEAISVPELFKVGVTNELSRRIEARIQKIGNFQSAEEMKKDFLQVKRVPAENIYLAPGRIGFHYNSYSIACFAAGPTDAEFDIAELAELLRDGVLERLPRKKNK